VLQVRASVRHLALEALAAETAPGRRAAQLRESSRVRAGRLAGALTPWEAELWCVTLHQLALPIHPCD
jgi:hypothetical protein